MAIQGLMAGLNVAAAAAPLFFGENNIFSGKARQASRELERGFRQSQAMADVPEEMARVAQQRQMRASQGLGSAALGLYNQRQNIALGTGMQALRQQRPGSALAGVGGLVGAGMQGAAELALADEQARERNRMLSEQTQMQVGQMRQQSQLRKQQEAADYWGTRKAESAGAISGALSGIGQAVGTGLFAGAFGKTPSLGGAQPDNFMNARQIARKVAFDSANLAKSREQMSGLLGGFQRPIGDIPIGMFGQKSGLPSIQERTNMIASGILRNF